ncbi:MAG TPA: four helix bundle protein [Vicinamibacterales bacterium]|nr:four helix bundle protein [Vicinamibacterales bacterium]
MAITSFRDLVVWQRAMVLVERIYELTECFPRHEQYGLTTQLRRAAVSIPSNIAEGQARRTGYFLNHLNMASGSEAELQTQLELAARLHLGDRGRIEKLLAESSEVGRMLHALAASVERDRDSSTARQN